MSCGASGREWDFTEPERVYGPARPPPRPQRTSPSSGLSMRQVADARLPSTLNLGTRARSLMFSRDAGVSSNLTWACEEGRGEFAGQLSARRGQSCSRQH